MKEKKQEDGAQNVGFFKHNHWRKILISKIKITIFFRKKIVSTTVFIFNKNSFIIEDTLKDYKRHASNSICL